MESHLPSHAQLGTASSSEAGELLTRMAARLILSHQREDGTLATRPLARQLDRAAQECKVQRRLLIRAVTLQLPAPAARRLTDALLPASLVPRAPWTRKSCVYRTLDALPPVRWSRYLLCRSRYAWVRQRAAERLGLDAFITVERATDAAVARFASVVSLRCFAHQFFQRTAFRNQTVKLVRALAILALENPSGASQRLSFIALLELSAWQAQSQASQAPPNLQLGAELVMMAIPSAKFDVATAQIRGLMAVFEEVTPAHAPELMSSNLLRHRA